MITSNESLLQAGNLKAEILAAPTVWIPRRDIILAWLDGFVKRAQQSTYELRETEEADLVALGSFLRRRKVPELAAAS